MHFVKAKGILSQNNGMNIYRGCTHGCIYCDARSKCYGMDHVFEDVQVKENALELLEKSLISKRKKCMIITGAMSDPYINHELKLEYTRKSLELIDKYGFGVSLQTKSTNILRDLDLIKSINQKTKTVVQMTLTTFDEDLCRKIEPNVSSTKERFEALKTFRDNDIPTVVWIDPFLPFINDTEENLRGILGYCSEAKVKGIINFYMGLTLREGNREYFYNRLDKHFPGLREKYQNKYGFSYGLISDNADKLTKILHAVCKENGIESDKNKVFSYLHEFIDKQKAEQLELVGI